MGCGITTVKYLLFIFNFLFAICALILLIIGALTLSDVNEEDLTIYAICLIVVGAIGFIIAFYGCCGAIRESHCMVVTFAVFLLIVLILEIVLGIFLYIGREEIESALTESYDYFEHYRTGNSAIDKEVDNTQQTFRCCGLDGPDYWTRQGFAVPESCCEDPKPSCADYYNMGCREVIDFILELFAVVGGTIFGVTALIE
ncbi:hypothetical protein L9F63_006772, partial [Diploptera punctata]